MSEPVVTVVTGARKGIGRYLAEHYVQKGHRVIGCSRKPAEFQADQYQHYCLDVADEAAVVELFREIRKNYRRLDVLINNAGAAAMNSVLLTPGSQLQALLDTNVKGTFLCSREAAKLMRPGKFGRIVNFVTVAIPWQLEGEAAYVAAKSAVLGLTRVMARELASFGITINAVGPTPVATDLIRNVPPEKIKTLVARQAVRRLGEFRDVANVVDFFIRPESDFVTGQVVYLGGVS